MKGLKRYYEILARMTIVFMVLYPFIALFHVEKAEGKELEYFAKKSKVIVDLFYYNKEVFLVVFAVIVLILLAAGAIIYYIISEKQPTAFLPDKMIVIALGIYIVLNVLSCVLSEYREYGLMGLSLDYEGLAAILGYMVLFLAGYVLFRKERTERFLSAGLQVLAALIIAGTFAESLWGTMFNQSWLLEKLMPARYGHLLERIYFDYQGVVSLTFGNPGFFGGFCGLLVPIIFGMALSSKTSKIRFGNALLGGGLFFCIIMSGSSGALYGAILAIVLEVVFLYDKERRKDYIKTFGIFVVFFVALLACIQFNRGEKEGSISDKVQSSFINSQYTKKADVFSIDIIDLIDGKLNVQGEKNSFSAEVLSDSSDMSLADIRITNDEGKDILNEYEEQNTRKAARLEGEYRGITITVMGRTISFDFGYQEPVEFYAKGKSLYYIDFNGSLLSSIPQPAVTGLDNVYPLFTGRGYIWVSSVPMLKDSLILGKGIGTFPFYYPQSEVAGMLNVHGSADYCIEQAHSWYLQTAVSSGLLSLLCLLFVLGVCLKRGIVRQVHNRHAEKTYGDYVMWGLVAYLTVGLVNNSCVATTPLFWLLLGYYYSSLSVSP